MIRVGMVGEYPTDINAIVSLLNQKYSESFKFFPLIFDIHGSNLENPKIKHQLRREYQIEKPEFIIFIRDLDGLEDNRTLLRERKSYFTEFNKVVDNKGIFLLNIYELEALLLADIETVNNYYKCNLPLIQDCMLVAEPKEFLKSSIKNYSTGDNPHLFSKLHYNTVLKNCRYFQDFDLSLKSKIQK